jgi:chaperonin GroEL
MAKNVHFSDESLKKVVEGVDILANAVKTTLGPRGRTVMMRTNYAKPLITKDGVTIANEIELADPIQDLGAQIVKQAAQRTNDIAGDGTTTSTVLAQALVREGVKYVNSGIPASSLKRGIDKAVARVGAYIKDNAIKIDLDTQFNKVKEIATISANSDEEIGTLVAQAIQTATADGAVAIEEATTPQMFLETVSGFQFERGFVSPQFINRDDKTVELSDAYVLLVNKKISSQYEIESILNQIVDEDGSKGLIIIANDFGPHVLSVLVLNKLRGVLPNVVAVKSPSYGENQREMLEDLAILTGATVVDNADGIVLKDIDLSYLGTAGKVTVNSTHTVIADGKGYEEEINNRLNALRKEVQETEKDYMLPFLQQRIGKISGGVAVIHVGGATDPEIKEKKDRVIDALNAARAAIKEGIVPGGGYILAKAAHEVDLEEGLDDYEKFGAKAVKTTLLSPFNTICENAAVSPEVKLSQVSFESPNIFYNAATDTIEDLVETGVIDPAVVPRVALYNAASVAGVLLMSNVIITNDDKELDLSEPPMMPF